MNNKDIVNNIVFPAIDQVNEKIPPEQQIEKLLDSVWLGPEGVLDSLGLTFLIVSTLGPVLRTIKNTTPIKPANSNID